MLPARFAHAAERETALMVMVLVLNLAVTQDLRCSLFHMIYILSGYMCYVLAGGSAQAR